MFLHEGCVQVKSIFEVEEEEVELYSVHIEQSGGASHPIIIIIIIIIIIYDRFKNNRD